MKAREGVALWGGPLGFLLLFFLVPSSDWGHDGALAGTAWWMLWWWLSGAVPIGATSLLPLVLFPVLGVLDLKSTAAPFGSRFIWLFLGGFVLALALERHGLHRRFALRLLKSLGGGPRRTLLGFMLATALLSMWISNTATTLMMLPMATAVLGLLEERYKGVQWGGALILGVAYAANVGGMATLVGTPPNAALASVAADRFAADIGFAQWLSIGLPISIVLLTVVYLLLVALHRIPKGHTEASSGLWEEEYRALGPMSSAERRVMILFAGTALMWILRSPFNFLLGEGYQLNDTSIAVAAALCCFAVSTGGQRGQTGSAAGAGVNGGWSPRLLGSGDLARLPWEILLLFGGGLALAKGFEAAGWASAVADAAAGWGWSVGTMLILVTAMGLFATELMSNLALTLLLTPVVGALAVGMGLHPLFFAVPVTLASSCAFMLPMATPPNAIVFASGRIRMATMARTGLVLNTVACAIILLMWWWGAPEAWR
ncbi:MAG: SLC13/DASS family transporter [Flavobacteriales bacterium]|nr:SLC13/DASS family transporter [Flavobacteriales bacterium]